MFWRGRGGRRGSALDLAEGNLKGRSVSFTLFTPHDAMATSPAVHPLQLMDGVANMHQAVSVLLGTMLSFIKRKCCFVFFFPSFFEGLFALQQTSLAVCFTLFLF